MSVLARLKRVNARPAPEESVALRAAVLVAVMAAAVAVLREGVGGPPLRLAVAAIPAAFWFSHRTRHREGFWVKVCLAVGALAAFGHFLSSLGAVQAGSLATAQAPLAELFVWMQLLHAFDVPARRDLLFSLVSSLVLVAIAGVLSVSMGLLVPLAVWGVAAASSLVLSHRSELSGLPALACRPGTARRTSVLRPVAAVVGLVLLVGSGAFLLLPPAGGARALTFPQALARAVPVPDRGGLSNPSLGADDPGRAARGRAGHGRRQSFGYFGFSDRLDTGVRGRPDDTLVMRVRASHPDFWRGQTFDVWDGRRWTISDDRPTPVAGAAPLDIPPVAGDQGLPGGGELVQTFFLKRPGPNLVFGASRIATLYFPDRRVFQLSDGTLRAGVGLGEDAVYTVVSRRPDITEATLRTADRDPAGVPPSVARRYTQLSDVPTRVRQLARRVTANAPTTYDKVRALEAWMAAHTRYSLDVPRLPRGADAVDRFLFVDRRGFCEQIGTSLVVMLRSLGIPARLAAGYTPGQRNPFTGLYEVRGSDAHAWAEVWFSGLGWQGFDPTASVPLAGDSGLSGAGAGLPSYLAARLPHPPVWAIAGAFVAGVLAATGAGLVRVVAIVRRRRRARTWPDLALARLERVGAARGRQRGPGETVVEYAAALREAGIADDGRLDAAAEVICREAFSDVPVSDRERVAVDDVLAVIDRPFART